MGRSGGMAEDRSNSLVAAVLAGDCSLIRPPFHLSDNLQLKFGSLLLLACSSSSLSVVHCLLNQDSSLEFVNAHHPTTRECALHVASRMGRTEIMEVLLANNADTTARDACGRRPADVAKNQSIMQRIKTIHDQFAELNTTKMHDYAKSGTVEDLTLLFHQERVQEAVDINSLLEGSTILHEAAKREDTEMVKWALEHRADPFVRDSKGKYFYELTRNEKIKNLFKESSKTQQPLQTGAHGLPVLSGTLFKWTNYATGYKPRWFVLEDGLLSYYKSKEDVPNSCRATIGLKVATVWQDKNDLHRFDLLKKGSFKFHLRAEHRDEARRWVHALQTTKTILDSIPLPAGSPLSDVSTTPDSPKHRQQASVGSVFWTDNVLGSPHEDSHVTNACRSHFELALSIAEGMNVPSLETAIRAGLGTFEVYVSTMINAHATLNALAKESSERAATFEEALHKMAADYTDIEAEARTMDQKIRQLSNEPEKVYLDKSDDEFFDAVDTGLSIGQAVDGYESDDYSFVENLRKSLPVDHAVLRREVSLWSVLKTAVGKDLTRITLPVHFNEPISMLQRICEEIEYIQVLENAWKRDKSDERMLFVAAFAISSYASTVGRTGKPFNPLLGETFEYVRKDKGYRYLAEQVSHHPPIGACHCESDRYTFFSEVSVRNKFWGKSLEVFPLGVSHVVLKLANGDEHYSFRKVTTCVNNIIVGTLWIDHYGDMEIVNHSTKEKAIITFKKTGWRNSNRCAVEGKVIGTCRELLLEGQWDDKIIAHVDGEDLVLWKRMHYDLTPSNFNLTPFALTLNQIPGNLLTYACPTDCRFRPDQQAMEKGEYDLASQEKHRLEEKQRKVRKDLDAEGIDHLPRWFVHAIDEDTGEGCWRFTGEYWTVRERNAFNVPNIY